MKKNTIIAFIITQLMLHHVALAQPCSDQSLLTLPTHYAVGGQPRGLECGDVNNDGVQDIVSVNQLSQEFWVVLLDDQGGVISRTAFDTERYGRDLVLQDFNLDGALDVAISGGSVELVVHYNDGSGGYGPPEFLHSAMRPRLVESADMNGDGVNDLVCLPTDSLSIAILHTLPGSGFEEAQHIEIDRYSAWVQALDLNDDGLSDLIYSQIGSVEVRINLGNGIYTSPFSYPVSDGGIIDADTGDFDGDGDLDIALLIDDEDGLAHIQTLEQIASGVFVSSTRLDIGYSGSAQNLAVGDVLGDARADIVISDLFGTDKIYVYQSMSDGGFSRPKSFMLYGSYTSDIDLHDMNNDGYLEILTTNGTSDSVTVIYNKDNQDFQTTRLFGVDGTHLNAVQGIDIDADGDQDILSRDAKSGRIVIAKNDGGGEFEDAEQFLSGPGVGLVNVYPIDLVGRGTPDLITIKGTSSRMSLFIGDGEGAFELLHVFVLDRDASGAVVLDADNDGDPDVLVKYSDSNRGPDLFLNQGFFSLLPQGEMEIFRNSLIAQAFDVDHDGDQDILGLNQGDIQMFLNDGTGTFVPGQLISVGAYCDSFVSADINGDQEPDFVAGSTLNAEIRVLLSDGSGQYYPAQVLTDLQRPTQLQIVDIDLDGTLDVAFSENYGQAKVLFNSGDHQFSKQSMLSFPVLGSYVPLSVSDFTGDGRPDFIQAVEEEIFLNLNTCSDRTETCQADFNDDGQLNFFDVAEFITQFQSQSQVADLNEDGSVNFFDVSAFLIAFIDGCP